MTVPGGTYRGPTWSWVSLDRPVSFSFPKACLEEQEKIQFAEIIEATSVLADRNNPFGPARQAKLVVGSHICNVRWRLDDYAQGKGMLQLVRTDSSGASSLSSDFEGSLDHPHVHQKSSADMIALLIAEATESRSFRSAGLLLISEPGHSRHYYSRIGVWIDSSSVNATFMKSGEPVVLTIV